MKDEKPSEWALRVAEKLPRRRLQVDRDTDVAMLIDEVRTATATRCAELYSLHSGAPSGIRAIRAEFGFDKPGLTEKEPAK